MKNLEDIQALSREGMEATSQSFAAASQGAQALATEFADYARRSLEQGTKAFEQMSGVRSIERAVELQTSYAKSAYEAFVSQATKFSEIYSDTAKQSFKPLEAYVNKVKP